MLRESNSILEGKNEVVEFFLSRETDSGIARLQTATAIISSLLYICHNNADYNDAFWRILRGELPAEAIPVVK